MSHTRAVDAGRVATPTRREGWIDVVRGLAVALVVLDHAEDQVTAHVAGMPAVMTAFNDAAQPFRMATLVFLSGMLLQGSLRKSTGRYVSGKLRRIGWPYLVWSVIFVALFMATGSLTGNVVSPIEFVAVLWSPPGHLWYLYYLLGYYAIGLVLRRVPSPVLVAAGLVLSVLVPAQEDFWYLLAFFFLGDLTRRHGDRWSRWVRNRVVQVVAVVVTLVTVVLAVSDVVVRYQAEYAWGSLAGIVVFSALAHAVARTRIGRWIGENGRESVIYYVTHWPVIIVTFHLATRAGIDHAVPLLLAGLVAGFGSGFAMTHLARRWPMLMWLYEWPAPGGPRRP